MEFKVRSEKIKSAADRINEISGEIRRAGDIVRSVAKNIPGCDDSYVIISNKLMMNCAVLETSCKSISTMGSGLNMIGELYQKTEKSIFGYGNGKRCRDYQKTYHIKLIPGHIIKPDHFIPGFSVIVGTLGFNDELDRIKELATIEGDATISYDKKDHHFAFDVIADGNSDLCYYNEYTNEDGSGGMTDIKPYHFEYHLGGYTRDEEGRFAPIMSSNYNAEGGIRAFVRDADGTTRSTEMGVISGSGTSFFALMYDENGQRKMRFNSDDNIHIVSLRNQQHMSMGDNQFGYKNDSYNGFGTFDYEHHIAVTDQGVDKMEVHGSTAAVDVRTGNEVTIGGISFDSGIFVTQESSSTDFPVTIDATDTGVGVRGNYSDIGGWYSIDYSESPYCEQIQQIKHNYKEYMNNAPFIRNRLFA